MVLLQGSHGVRFLVSELPLQGHCKDPTAMLRDWQGLGPAQFFGVTILCRITGVNSQGLVSPEQGSHTAGGNGENHAR